MSDDEGRAALEAAKEAVERAQFLDMLPASVAEAAIKAYLAALPGWRLVPIFTNPWCSESTKALQAYWGQKFECLPPPPGLEDSSE